MQNINDICILMQTLWWFILNWAIILHDFISRFLLLFPLFLRLDRTLALSWKETRNTSALLAYSLDAGEWQDKTVDPPLPYLSISAAAERHSSKPSQAAVGEPCCRSSSSSFGKGTHPYLQLHGRGWQRLAPSSSLWPQIPKFMHARSGASWKRHLMPTSSCIH